MKFSVTLFSLTGLLGFALAGAPIKNQDLAPDATVPNRYIVTYKNGASSSKRKQHQDDITKKAKKNNKEGVVDTININGLEGYVAEVSKSELKEIIDFDLVDYIEKDSIVNLNGVAAPQGPHQLDKRAATTQANAPWGLARIGHKSTSNDGNFDPGYYYHTTAGSGVRVYVIDTGIRITHSEFSGRAIWGANYVNGSLNTDENGHGTHVSGTIAGKTYGVAKLATLVAVKVLDKNGSGFMSDIILGINWAVNNAKSKGVANKSVINMSVGGFYTASVNAAVQAATNAGLTVVVAAGNNNDDASFYSPASAPSAITVGAVEATNYRGWFSNYGSLVDIFAPGVGVLSSWGTSDSATRYLAGTSMASPHVAGLAAYFIAKEGLTGAAVGNRVLSAAVSNVVADPEGSTNKMAYNGNGR